LAFNELDAEVQADFIENGIAVETQISEDVEMDAVLNIGASLSDENFDTLSSSDSGVGQAEVDAVLTVGVPLSEQGVVLEPVEAAVPTAPTSTTVTDEPINQVFLPLISR